MIFQDPMSCLNPVLQSATSSARPCGEARARRTRGRATRAVELLDQVGIPAAGAGSARYPHELSGGMRQRVMIAMAIASRGCSSPTSRPRRST